MKHQAHESEFEDEEPQIKPLTPEEAAVWRKRQPKMSMWRIVALQVLVGVVIALVAWLVAGRAAGWSAAYGALAIVVPAALFARGVARNSGGAANAGVAGGDGGNDENVLVGSDYRASQCPKNRLILREEFTDGSRRARSNRK